jgi:hypothetical protein
MSLSRLVTWKVRNDGGFTTIEFPDGVRIFVSADWDKDIRIKVLTGGFFRQMWDSAFSRSWYHADMRVWSLMALHLLDALKQAEKEAHDVAMLDTNGESAELGVLYVMALMSNSFGEFEEIFWPLTTAAAGIVGKRIDERMKEMTEAMKEDI